MPFTRKQTRFLLSNGSPLGDLEKVKIKIELHKHPALGHKPKGESIRDYEKKEK